VTTTPTIWEPLHQANPTDAGNQSDLAVVDIGLGRYIVVWTELSGGPIAGVEPGDDIVGQIYDAEGNLIGNEFRVPPDWNADDETNPALASRPGGGFVMVFEDTDAAGTSIRVQVYHVNGDVVAGAPINIVDDLDGDTLSNPSVGVRDDGSFLVAYQRSDNAGDTDIVGVIVNADGTVGAEFTIFSQTDDAGSPEVAVLSSGDYVVVYHDESSGDGANRDPEFRIVSSAGAILGGTVISVDADDQTDVQVAALTGGGFVAVWTEENGDGNGDGIRGVIYDNDGDLQGSIFTVNTSTTGVQFAPDVTALDDGGFVVVWDDNNLGETRGQRFDASGAMVGAEFVAGSLGAEVEPVVALLGDGRFIAGFEQVGGPETDVHGTIFDPRENVIDGTGEVDVITARLEGATVNGLAGDDVLLGQGGNDVLNGGAGDDEMYGRAGNDTYHVDSVGDDVNESANNGIDHVIASVDHPLANHVENLTLVGTAGFGVGNGLANIIIGNALNNSLLGLPGNDILNGGGGADTMQGGADNDTYIVDNLGDTATESAGAGIDHVQSSVNFTLGPNVENLTLTGVVAATGTGNDLANFITGNNAANTLSGLGGIDTIRGGGGNDTVSGGDGNDRLDGGIGADAVHGGAGDDIVLVDNAGDTVAENAGEGFDHVISTVTFTLGANLEKLTLTGVALAGVGNAIANTIIGNDAANRLIGRGGEDTLLGEAGKDRLKGGKGDDILSGGLGRDKLAGSGGKDAFVFDMLLGGGNVDKIKGFKSKTDKIWLDTDVFAAIGGRLGKGELEIGRKADDANDYVIFNEGNGKVFYDADGDGIGGQVLFARLGKNADLVRKDFAMIEDFAV
jgi:Ca2+-binding RTX toxin-like protein